MRWEIVFAISVVLSLIVMPMAFAEPKHFSISLKENDGRLVFMNLNVIAGDAREKTMSGNEIIASMMSYDSKVLSEKTLLIAPNSTTEFEIPYDPKTAAIKISYPKSNRTLNISTIAFADLCGDNLCQKNENSISCSIDCVSGTEDGFCDGLRDGRCDKDCTESTDFDCRGQTGAQATTTTTTMAPEEQVPGQETTTSLEEQNPDGDNKGSSSAIFIIIGVVAIIGIIGAIFTMSMMRGKTTDDSKLKEFIVNSMNQGYNYYEIRNHLISNGYNQQAIDKVFESLKDYNRQA